MNNWKPLKSGYHDPTPNLVLRELGYGCYSNDLDAFWYSFPPNSNTPEPIALFEFKHFNLLEFDKTQLAIARVMASKLELPLFLGITFTKNEEIPESRECLKPVIAEHPMFHLLPGNESAERYLSLFDSPWFGASDLISLNGAICCHRFQLRERFSFDSSQPRIKTQRPVKWQSDALRIPDLE